MAINKIAPKREIRLIAKKLKVNVKFSKSAKCALCKTDKREITIPNQPYQRDDLLSMFFHEYSHQVCYDLHIYDKYHRVTEQTRKTKDFQDIMFKAEVFVDRMGRDFCKLYDKSIKYTRMYLVKDKKSIVKFLRSFHKIEN